MIKFTCTCLAAAALAFSAPAALLAQDNSSTQFAFLEGNWVMKEGKGEFHERWTRNADNTFSGFGFMLSAKGDTLMREVLRIQKIGRHWVYIAAINKDEPTLFTLRESKNNTWVFENKEHSFPQRIAYQQKPDGSLLAWIEGKMLGKVRKEEYPMQRVK